MLKVPQPSKNKRTQGYSSKHKAYDFDDIPDKNYYSSLYGKVVQSKNSETKNWINTGKLTTRDYGNYIKIKGEVDGETVYQLGAHFQQGTVLSKGTEVKRGQVVAQAGRTGNIRPMHGGDGSHSHTEYRNSVNKNIPVVFVKNGEEPKEVKKDMQSKEQIIKDAYFAITGEYPSPDALKARLQKNENTAELIYDLLNADGKSKPHWLEIWEVKESPATPDEDFKDWLADIKLVLTRVGGKSGMDSIEIKTLISNLVTELLVLRDKQVPKPRIIYAEKQMVYIKIFEFFIGVIKRGDKNE